MPSKEATHSERCPDLTLTVLRDEGEDEWGVLG
jgi:hypothetical protein